MVAPGQVMELLASRYESGCCVNNVNNENGTVMWLGWRGTSYISRCKNQDLLKGCDWLPLLLPQPFGW